jgi:hypothetical protein
MAQNDPRAAEVEAREAAKNKSVAEYYEREAASRPPRLRPRTTSRSVGALGDAPLRTTAPSGKPTLRLA